LQFEVRPALAEGHYTTTIILPIAGTWHWRSDVFGKHAMPPLTAYAEPGSVAQTSDPPRQAAIGQVLFVAKGLLYLPQPPSGGWQPLDWRDWARISGCSDRSAAS
jgi:hypothetical protein